MKTISLSQGKITIVDDDDYKWLSRWKWYFRSGYAVRVNKTETGKVVTVWMHREIINTPVGMFTDHKNLDKLDNRKINLRVCTNIQNQKNSLGKKSNTSGYTGVQWHSGAKKWRASIFINSKHISLGLYKNKEDAARAYDKALVAEFGEFARTNL
jgi:hypothetical protein